MTKVCFAYKGLDTASLYLRNEINDRLIKRRSLID